MTNDLSKIDISLYTFSTDETDGNCTMSAELGGKGANLAEMCLNGMPVPAGFTIPTSVGNMYRKANAADRANLLEALMDGVLQGVEWIKTKQGGPVLLSVRSGAPVSMPGMMDTILNVGLCAETWGHWSHVLGERTVRDSYRRLIQMLGSTAYDIPMSVFDTIFDKIKEKHGVSEDHKLTAAMLSEVLLKYKAAFKEVANKPFSAGWVTHLRDAIVAVFDSWMSPRAVEYRKQYGISDEMGTAVTIQAMVFGNLNDKSGTGVMFTRDPATGDNDMYGEFLENAQGEDVVAGIRTPMPIEKMLIMPEDTEMWQGIHAQLGNLACDLEDIYDDMLDVEFTIQDGKLYVLQCRIGKRSGLAAITIAKDFWETTQISEAEFWKRITPEQYVMASRPSIGTGSDVPKADGIGLAASPGVAVGEIVYSADKAVAQHKLGKKVILVTKETNPDDIHGMFASEGILTATGGATSHAAVVARGMEKPCVVGLTALTFGDAGGVPLAGIAGTLYPEGTKVTIDGNTGRVWFGVPVPVQDTSDSPVLKEVCDLALSKQGMATLLTPVTAESASPVYVAFDGLLANPDLLPKAVNMAKNGSKVIVDLKSPHAVLGVSSSKLHSLFEDGTDMHLTNAVGVVEMLIALNLDHVHSGNILVAGEFGPDLKSALELAGFSSAGFPKNVGDLMTMDYAELTDEFINSIFGGVKPFNAFKAAVAGKLSLPKPAPRPAHPDYAVFTAIAGSGSK